MDLSKRFEIHQQLGEGSFSKIYQAFDKKLQLDVALKVEKEDKHKKILKFEYEILKNLQGIRHVPKLYDFVENTQKSVIFSETDHEKSNGNKWGVNNNLSHSEGLNFIEMELLGKNVANYKKAKQSFDPLAAYDILTQMLDAIENLHDRGYIHRDIKPTNFVVKENNYNKSNFQCKNNSNTVEIYMVDYGLAKVHLDRCSRPIPPRLNTDFRGTLTYASLNAHYKKELSRRDDLWSFFFVILDLLNENLPWRTCKDDKDDIKKMKEVCLADPEKKLLLTTSKGKKEILSILNHLKTLSYEDRPNYYLIRSKLFELRNSEICKLTRFNNSLSAGLNNYMNLTGVQSNNKGNSNCIIFDSPTNENFLIQQFMIGNGSNNNNLINNNNLNSNNNLKSNNNHLSPNTNNVNNVNNLLSMNKQNPSPNANVINNNNNNNADSNNQITNSNFSHSNNNYNNYSNNFNANGIVHNNSFNLGVNNYPSASSNLINSANNINNISNINNLNNINNIAGNASNNNNPFNNLNYLYNNSYIDLDSFKKFYFDSIFNNNSGSGHNAHNANANFNLSDNVNNIPNVNVINNLNNLYGLNLNYPDSFTPSNLRLNFNPFSPFPDLNTLANISNYYGSMLNAKPMNLFGGSGTNFNNNIISHNHHQNPNTHNAHNNNMAYHGQEECNVDFNSNLNQNIGHNLNQNIGHNLSQNIAHSLNQNLSNNLNPNITHNISQNLNNNINQNINPTINSLLNPLNTLPNLLTNILNTQNNMVNKKRKRDSVSEELLSDKKTLTHTNNNNSSQQNQIFIINQFYKNNMSDLEKQLLLEVLLKNNTQSNNDNNMNCKEVNKEVNNTDNSPEKIPEKTPNPNKPEKKKNEYNINSNDKLLIDSITKKLKPTSTPYNKIPNTLNNQNLSINTLLNQICSGNDFLLNVNNIINNINSPDMNQLLSNMVEKNKNVNEANAINTVKNEEEDICIKSEHIIESNIENNNLEDPNHSNNLNNINKFNTLLYANFLKHVNQNTIKSFLNKSNDPQGKAYNNIFKIEKIKKK